MHGTITGSLPKQCEFKFGALLRRNHTFVALSITRKLVDSSLLQVKKCYYFTFLFQDPLYIHAEVAGQGSRNYYLFGFFLPEGETVPQFLSCPERQARHGQIDFITCEQL